MIISGQIRQIDLIQLTQLQIQKSSSFTRTVFNNIKILRRKKYKIYNSKKLSCFFNRKPVDCSSFCLVFPKMHVQLVRKTILFYHHPDVSILLTETDHLSVLTSLMRLCCPTKIYRFQNICFSLCIIPVKNICFPVKIQLKGFIIPEIF